MTGLSVFKVKKRSFLIVNFPLFIGKDVLCGEAKRNGCYTFQGISFRLILLV